jgi:hypothetical protein
MGSPHGLEQVGTARAFPPTTRERTRMTTTDKPIPPTIDQTEQEPSGGPTAPVASNDEKSKGPKTGGYDEHTPDHTESNEKGGYGAG